MLLTAKALFIVAMLGATADTYTLGVDAQQDAGIIPAIHGTTNGPLVKQTWAPPCGNDNAPSDWTAQYQEAQVPSVRMHGAGSMDMNSLWLPWPSYAGADPTDPQNYNWEFIDEALAAHSDVSTPFLRFGPSGNHGISEGGGCDPDRPTASPPDSYEVYAQVVVHILKHVKEGWGCLDAQGQAEDCGTHYDVTMAEVWNEFYIRDFWDSQGPETAGTEAAKLYQAVADAVHAVFPEFWLGPSINFPNGPQAALPRDFWCYARRNGLRIDFIAPHFYRTSPNAMHATVHSQALSDDKIQEVNLCEDEAPVPRPDPNWEAYLQAYGFEGTPIVNAEWNRDGDGVSCYNNGQRGDTIPAGAFVAGSLIAMAEMHPENSTHNVILSHLFSSRSQLFVGGDFKAPGIGLMAYGKYLYGETPVRLSSSGGWDDSDHEFDLKVMAGRAEDSQRVNVLISSYDITEDCPTEVGGELPVELVVEHLPWGDGPFLWERWEHTSAHAFTLVDSGEGHGGTLTRSDPIRLNTVVLYRLSGTSDGSSDPPTAEPSGDATSGDTEDGGVDGADGGTGPTDGEAQPPQNGCEGSSRRPPVREVLWSLLLTLYITTRRRKEMP